MTILNELSANLRPIPVHDLRSELGSMHNGEALLLVVNGREFVVVGGADWGRIIEEASDDRALPLVPEEF
jgi:hypothetical protein